MTGSGGEAPRVLHVSQPGDGGVARCVADFVAHQTARGWRCFVACRSWTPLATAVRGAGAVQLRWAADRSPGPGAPAEIAALARIVRDVDPDIVHLHSSKAGLAGRLAVRGRRPTVFQPHGWSFHAARGPQARAAVAWERLAARFADAIVCVSEGERRAALAHGIRGDLRVVPNGVDLDRYEPIDGQSRPDVRRALGLPVDAKIVLLPGRLSEQKGQDVMLGVWPAVVAAHPEARLVLLGEGPLRPTLERAADRTVTLVGNRPDVARWLHAADLVVLPSRWEGMSLAMLEAMATGRSVVATAVDGADEALAGGGGAVVPAGDRRRLVDEIVVRLEDEAITRSEGLAGRRAAEARFDVRRTRDAIVEIYEDLLGSPDARIVRRNSRTSSAASSG